MLVHAFPPDADIPPVVQLSINAEKPLDYHLDLGGARLAPLRDSGILIVGSGNIVHNLRAMDPGTPDSGFDWAARFDEAARELLTASPPADMVRLTEHPDYAAAVPTPDHFIPSLYFAGLLAAAEPSAAPDILIDGYTYGSLSMTSYAA